MTTKKQSIKDWQGAYKVFSEELDRAIANIVVKSVGDRNSTLERKLDYNNVGLKSVL